MCGSKLSRGASLFGSNWPMTSRILLFLVCATGFQGFVCLYEAESTPYQEGVGGKVLAIALWTPWWHVKKYFFVSWLHV
jgi:hypothetical protein